jgi:hypothetical protein
MAPVWVCSALLAVALVLASGCAGGGGGFIPPNPVSELAGGWLGPTGGASPGGNLGGTGPGGMLADLSGAFAGTGAFTGKTGQIAHVGGSIFKLTRTDASIGFILLSKDKNYLTYIDSNQQFGMWQRTTVPAGMPPFTTADVFSSNWEGEVTSFDGAFEPTSLETMLLAVNATGAVTATSTSTNAMTQAAPAALVDGLTGEFTGDLVDVVDTATYTLLLSSDREAMAVFVCGTAGAFPQDCSVAIFQKP